MIGVTGRRSTITKALKTYDTTRLWTMDDDYYVLSAGLIRDRQWLDQTFPEIVETLTLNLIEPVNICETLLSEKPDARICIMGSESGFKGSYDMAYALSKAAVHAYVEMKALGPDQQLFALSPWIIKDSNMAKKRHDYDVIKHRPYIESRDVAEIIWRHFHEGTNGVIRCHRTQSKITERGRWDYRLSP